MSIKKRLYAIFFTLIFCISTLTVNVLAQTTQEKADVLNQVNVLKGSGGDYNLSAGLKRTEAAALIVRLMGYENHVNERANLYSIITFPDADSTQWYAPYVGYCSINKIISGNQDGYFEPNKDISEKSFLKLVLCALGYVYNTDFSWNDIYSKAYNVGLVTDYSYVGKTDDNSNFKRSQAVDILFNALRLVNQKTGKEMFNSLIDNGVITREIALKAGLIEDTITTAIDEVTATDTNKVSVKFNENIKTLPLDNIMIYESDDSTNSLVFEINSQYENEIVLETPSQKPGTEYTVVVLGALDEDGNVSGTLRGTFKGYVLEVEDVESDFFRIESIEPINEKTVKVYFTHPVNVNSELAKYYRIYDGESLLADGNEGEITVKALSSPNNVAILSLNREYFDQDVIYSLEINGDLTSSYGVKLNDGSGDNMKFKSSEEASEPFALMELIPYDNETLLLNFNKEINPFLAGQIYNFYLTDEDHNPIKIEKTVVESVGKRSGKALFIHIEGTFGKDDEYNLTINNLSDVTRQEYITEKTYTFEADYGSKKEMGIDEVNVLDNQTLEVYFTIPLDQTTATTAAYYSIRGVGHTYTATPEKIFYEPSTDPNKVKLYLPGSKLLSNKKEYEIRIDNRMEDYLGNLIDSGSEEEFDGTSTVAKAPSIESAVAISSDAVKLTFDREIALDAPNILPNNYTLEYTLANIQYKKVPLSVIYINASTLIVRFDSLEYDVEYNIKYESIKSYSGIEAASTDNEDEYTSFMLVKE